jgi:hypothetical protein
MKDQYGKDLFEGDMVQVRIFGVQSASYEYAFVEGFRFGTHVVLKVRHGRKEPYVFNSNVVEKIDTEKAMMFLLENADV